MFHYLNNQIVDFFYGFYTYDIRFMFPLHHLQQYRSISI